MQEKFIFVRDVNGTMTTDESIRTIKGTIRTVDELNVEGEDITMQVIDVTSLVDSNQVLMDTHIGVKYIVNVSDKTGEVVGLAKAGEPDESKTVDAAVVAIVQQYYPDLQSKNYFDHKEEVPNGKAIVHRSADEVGQYWKLTEEYQLDHRVHGDSFHRKLTEDQYVDEMNAESRIGTDSLLGEQPVSIAYQRTGLLNATDGAVISSNASTTVNIGSGMHTDEENVTMVAFAHGINLTTFTSFQVVNQNHNLSAANESLYWATNRSVTFLDPKHVDDPTGSAVSRPPPPIEDDPVMHDVPAWQNETHFDDGTGTRRRLCRPPPPKASFPTQAVANKFKVTMDMVAAKAKLFNTAIGINMHLGAGICPKTTTRSMLALASNAAPIFALKRTYNRKNGEAYGKLYFCTKGECTLQAMTGERSLDNKNPTGKSRIPTGEYEVYSHTLHNDQRLKNKHGHNTLLRVKDFKQTCTSCAAGKVKRTDIYFHKGNRVSSWSEGCIIVAEKTNDYARWIKDYAKWGVVTSTTTELQQSKQTAESLGALAKKHGCTDQKPCRLLVFDCSRGDGMWANAELTSKVNSKQKTLWKKDWSSGKSNRRLDVADEHVGQMTDERRQLGTTRKRKTIKLLPTKCIPTPIWGLRICFGSNFFYEYGSRTTFGASGISFEPYAAAGLDGHASLNVLLGEIGLYVEGEFFRVSLPFQAQFSLQEKDICARIDAVSNGFSSKQGFYYRVVGCRFKWCCSIRCKLGGRRSVGSPSRRVFGSSSNTLFQTGC